MCRECRRDQRRPWIEHRGRRFGLERRFYVRPGPLAPAALDRLAHFGERLRGREARQGETFRSRLYLSVRPAAANPMRDQAHHVAVPILPGANAAHQLARRPERADAAKRRRPGVSHRLGGRLLRELRKQGRKGVRRACVVLLERGQLGHATRLPWPGDRPRATHQPGWVRDRGIAAVKRPDPPVERPHRRRIVNRQLGAKERLRPQMRMRPGDDGALRPKHGRDRPRPRHLFGRVNIVPTARRLREVGIGRHAGVTRIDRARPHVNRLTRHGRHDGGGLRGLEHVGEGKTGEFG